jgi:hypothetical protein
MTTTKETCPKCGAETDNLFLEFIDFDCGSIRSKSGEFSQSKMCVRITELEKEVERFRNSRSEQCQICMKYTTDWIEPDGSPGRICRPCESALLEKKG